MTVTPSITTFLLLIVMVETRYPRISIGGGGHSPQVLVPFGDQFWALSSICQCIAIHSKFPGKMSLYTVGTYSQHSVASNIFASRAVFAVLRPFSVALSRAPILGSCDPIIGPVAGALQSQRDALALRA